MTALNQYAPQNGRWVDEHGRLTMASQVWLRDLWFRAGGTSALTPAELEALIAAAQAEIDALELVVAGMTEGHAIEDEGVALTQRGTLNFVGSGVSAYDDGSKTVVQIVTPLVSQAPYAPGSFSVPSGYYAQVCKNLTLVSAQRATLAGTARMRID